MVERSLLVTRPNHDDATSYLSEWAVNIIDACRKRNIKFYDLDGSRANKEHFENVIKEKDPKLIALNGHGSEDSIYGHENEVIVNTNNCDLLESRIVHVIACESARLLGELCVQSGTIVYIGYNEAFVFIHDPNRSAQPLKDKIAEAFFESANKVVLSIIEGDTVQDAYLKSQRTYDNWIKHHLTHYSLETPWILSALFWNKAHQTIIGNKNATF